MVAFIERTGAEELSTVLGYLELRLPEFDWKAAHPHLTEWFARISERPSFATRRPRPQRFCDPVV
jgi:glutathione S-transferase